MFGITSNRSDQIKAAMQQIIRRWNASKQSGGGAPASLKLDFYDAVNAGDYAEAFRLGEEILELEPENQTVQYQLALFPELAEMDEDVTPGSSTSSTSTSDEDDGSEEDGSEDDESEESNESGPQYEEQVAAVTAAAATSANAAGSDAKLTEGHSHAIVQASKTRRNSLNRTKPRAKQNRAGVVLEVTKGTELKKTKAAAKPNRAGVVLEVAKGTELKKTKGTELKKT